MVGIIVIGLIGGVIAATVFAVIPWTQDNAAQSQLDSIVQAENAYKGLSSSSASSLPAGASTNSFADGAGLEAANLMKTGPTYCTVTLDDGKGYAAYAKSSSGKIFQVTDKNSVASEFTGNVPVACQFLTPYVDLTPTLTVLTYKCDTTISNVVIPMSSNQKGTETWSDGVTKTYAGGEARATRTLTAGVTYTLTFDGTYGKLSHDYTLAQCLRSVNHWGTGSGVTDAGFAFSAATNLTDVPVNIPSSITNMAYMFNQATIFNDPDVSMWKTPNVTNMSSMFRSTDAFNQSLNDWDVSKVTTFQSMFDSAKAFNSPIGNWNTGKVTNLYGMFFMAPVFNQPVDKWDTSNVTNMSLTFYGAKAFNQPLNTWNTAKVTNFADMFHDATAFNQPLDKWNTGLATDTSQMFLNAKAFNQSLNGWNVSNVTQFQNMFNGASTFNQPLNNWNTSKGQYLFGMFNNANAFNQNVSNWNTSSMTLGTNFANSTYNTSWIPAGTTLAP
jgi:surface protein